MCVLRQDNAPPAIPRVKPECPVSRCHEYGDSFPRCSHRRISSWWGVTQTGSQTNRLLSWHKRSLAFFWPWKEMPEGRDSVNSAVTDSILVAYSHITIGNSFDFW